jgi:hypothetical protein
LDKIKGGQLEVVEWNIKYGQKLIKIGFLGLINGVEINKR